MTRIGRYQLLRVLGEGGMGTVYLAEQSTPIRRSVALKLVRAGFDSREIVRRFERERRNLSRMEHHGIARVLDAGESESGQPYFVMELVDGLPITDYCDSHRLGIAERLKVFLQVCEAVGHAHHKGVIHRDLKPSNLLVAESADGCPRPKVIDFGIAKVMGEGAADSFVLTHATGLGEILGTPQYMSPEQAASEPPDTRTDVYGLGAVLYELLAGSAPLRRERLIDASFEEVLRLVREEEPERPSARIDALPPEERNEVAACRGESAESWLRQMRGDLDWIVLRAVEKEADRRYPSVAALAADLKRHLADEPVEARPPSRTYRLRKFARRNRALTATVAAIAAVLVGATAVSVSWALEAGKAKRLAEARLTQADAVHDFLIKAFRRTGSAEDSHDLLAVELLDQAASEAGVEFSEQPLMRARIFEALAQTYLRLGFYGKAEALVASTEDAVSLVSDADPELRARLLRILSETRRLERRMGEAVALSESNWHELRERVGVGSEEEMRARNEWITNLINAGELDRAEAALGEARAALERYPAAKAVDFQGLYASLRGAQGRHEEARQWMEERLAQRASSYLASDHDFMWRLRHLSNLLVGMERLEEAEAWSEGLVRCAAQVYGIDHHLTIEAVAIRANIPARRGSSDAAYFILRLARDEVHVRAGQSPGLRKLDEHLSRVKPRSPLAETIDARFEGRDEKTVSMAEPPQPLDAEPAVWVALSDCHARTGASERARFAAERAYDLSRSLSPDGDPRLTVRAARLIDLLSSAGKLEKAESVLAAHWTPAMLEPPTGRYLVDACEMLVKRLDEEGKGARARRLDHDRLLPALLPLASSMKPGRLSQSYRRIFEDLRDPKHDAERMRFQEAVSTALQAALPASDPFRRQMQIRLCEMLIARDRVEEARLHLGELKQGVEADGASAEINALLNLMVLESKLLRAAGDFDGAEKLLLASWSKAEGEAGAALEDDARSRHLSRLAVELRRHYRAIGDEAARRKWAERDLLESLLVGQGDDIRARAEAGDLEGVLNALEQEGATQFPATGRVRDSLQLADWLAEEFKARDELGLAARAAMEALRGCRRLGQGTAPVLRERFLQVQRGLRTLPSDEARLSQLSEIEGIFAQLLGPDDRQTWTIRSHRLVFLHSLAEPQATRPLIEGYFRSFPDEEKDRSTLRLRFHNHLARCLLDLGETGEAQLRLEKARRLAASLEGDPRIVEHDLREARIMTSNLFARLHRDLGDRDLAETWNRIKSDLEAQR